MRKKILLLLSIIGIIGFSAKAQKTAPVKKENKPYSYELDITVKGLKDTSLYLVNYYGDRNYGVDSGKVDKNGRVVFKGDSLATGVFMIYCPGKLLFDIMVEDRFMTIKTDTINPIKNQVNSGSLGQKVFNDYQKYSQELGEKNQFLMQKFEASKGNAEENQRWKDSLIALDKQVNEYRANVISKHPDLLLSKIFRMMKEPEVPEPPVREDGTIDSNFQFNYYRDHFWDNTDWKDERIARTPIFHKKLEKYMLKMTVPSPDSIIAAADRVVALSRGHRENYKWVVYWITSYYEKSEFMCMDLIFAHMAVNYYTKKDAFWMDDAGLERIRSKGLKILPLGCGKVAPNLIMEDSIGKKFSLHQTKAKYTVLVFWDPDCGHCQKEIPLLNKYYDTLKNYGVKIYSVGVEQDLDKWKKFLVEHKLEWINVQDVKLETGFRATYDITSTPVTFILDENKKIIAKKVSAEQIYQILKNELKIP